MKYFACDFALLAGEIAQKSEKGMTAEEILQVSQIFQNLAKQKLEETGSEFEMRINTRKAKKLLRKAKAMEKIAEEIQATTHEIYMAVLEEALEMEDTENVD